MDKFMGKPKTQKVAATVGETQEKEQRAEQGEQGWGVEENQAASGDSSLLLSQLLEQQRELSERIATWEGSGF